MSDRPFGGIDNQDYRARLSQPKTRGALISEIVVRQPFGPRGAPSLPVTSILTKQANQADSEQLVAAKPPTRVDSFSVITPQPFAHPASPKLQQSKVLYRRAVRAPGVVATQQFAPHMLAAPKTSGLNRTALTAVEPMTPPRTRISNQSKIEKKVPVRMKRKKLRFTLIGMVAAVLLVGLAAVQTNQPAKSQVLGTQTTAGTTTKTALPEETKPTVNAIGQYRVAADLPRLLIIPSLFVYAPVKSVTLNANNQLQTPDNIYDAGWYIGSAKPGAIGTVAIVAHTHGPTLPGIFANIKKLQVGDIVKIARGDGKTIEYVVVKTQIYDTLNLDMNIASTPAVPGKAGLNLITADGPHDLIKGSGVRRTIVFAVQS